MDDAFLTQVDALVEEFGEQMGTVAATEREFYNGMQYAIEQLQEHLHDYRRMNTAGLTS